MSAERRTKSHWAGTSVATRRVSSRAEPRASTPSASVPCSEDHLNAVHRADYEARDLMDAANRIMLEALTAD